MFHKTSTGAERSSTATKEVKRRDTIAQNRLITLIALTVMFLAVPGFPDPKKAHAATASVPYTFNSVNTGAGGGYVDGKGDVWKLNTATGVWTNISPVPSSSSNNFFGYGGIAVDAQHPDTLVVATLNAWWPDEQFYRSI